MKKILLLILLIVAKNSYAIYDVRKIVIAKNIENFTSIFDIDYRSQNDSKYRKHYDFGVQYNFTNDLEVTLKYRNIYLKNNREWKLNERRPQIQLSKKFEQKYFDLTARFRYDYQIISGKNQNRPRFRGQIIAKEAFFYLKPILGYEIYYNLTQEKLSQRRFELGAILPKFYYFTPSLFFRNDASKDLGKWDSNQFLVLRIDAVF